MNGLELLRQGLAPLLRREQDGVHREVRVTRQVSWDEVAQTLALQELTRRITVRKEART
jgi:hypothetical protein